MRIYENEIIADLSGMTALVSVGQELEIVDQYYLPECQVCDLLDQLATTPTSINVHDNLDDTCTPVPANCP